ncbi:cell wall hydrolase [Bradyrhizobium sp. U87765 SZCCT0131]|uniref:cell wall hydrolase n=1 Tax=unclassified Bradyrhizobium TaxID=2631580 RepID=UPI001BA74864|nr:MULTISPECIES: cell wall hydrolase [unclassified Bradyrhizobium]MBR1218112.1 cell wall hydrolase [Bradyrhizobium sp. U87765 SZCCT0131]MBR1260942.1 cell wall hydrolase [Bradyrhizobium sp. U87765 SZCCT0134]MBR1303610.1 cell wall hydrolase [Bradyrhizobium sp. U87765 SZCCT0110]MBR1319216.1 cell wall hydrolase [Bradyrhizobium sp. U87765 SZCCT0109]MBR1347541.1 cell wall hydrolase [Bradyrhizobium sp. U87765 SZCCT0048]
MSVLRNGPKGARGVPFGLSLCLFALLPSEIGYQDLAALLARQPGVAERSQRHIASTVAPIQVATFSFPRPIGTSLPRIAPVRLASLDSESSDITAAIARSPLGQDMHWPRSSDFPVVDRSLKGDRLARLAPEAEPDGRLETPETPSNANVLGAKTAEAAPSGAAEPAPLDEELQAALKAPPLPQYDATQSPDGRSAAGAEMPEAAELPPSTDGFSVKTASLFFGNGAMGVPSGALERWQPGEEPVVVLPQTDPDLKSAIAPAQPGATSPLDGKPAGQPAADGKGGTTEVGKGVAAAEPKRQKTPAERLNLSEKARNKAEKCLAEAVYFEARGEQVRGQIAVAQVVMNRVFSGFYPTTVCGVVYQNAHRHLACQFTFACDDVADVVREPDMWIRAKKIAKATMDGQLWLPEVGKSTHYHAYWVRPSWVHEMKKMYKYGVHTFYRPRAWGDGSDAPTWGNARETAAISAKL